MRPIHRQLPGLSVAALLLAACATSSTPTSAPATPAPAPPSGQPSIQPSVAPPASLPPFDCTATLHRPGTVPIARISGFDVANVDGSGRIVFSFRPEGGVAAVPEIDVRPGTPPFSLDPSGLPLEVRGSAFLMITLQGGTALDERYEPTFGGPFDVAPGGSPIVEVRRAGDFEAVSTFVVGLDGPPCVRILPSDDGGRVVIEIARA